MTLKVNVSLTCILGVFSFFFTVAYCLGKGTFSLYVDMYIFYYCCYNYCIFFFGLCFPECYKLLVVSCVRVVIVQGAAYYFLFDIFCVLFYFIIMASKYILERNPSLCVGQVFVG